MHLYRLVNLSKLQHVMLWKTKLSLLNQSLSQSFHQDHSSTIQPLTRTYTHIRVRKIVYPYIELAAMDIVFIFFLKKNRFFLNKGKK
jgi:hypothetical protein